MFLDLSLLGDGERRALGQHKHGDTVFVQVPFGDHDEVVFCISDAHFMQSFHRNGNHAQRLAWLLKLPARDGDHAIGLQMLEILAERLDRVKIVFAQRERACGGRSPGIDQRHLHDVELLSRISYERAAIRHVNLYVGAFTKSISLPERFAAMSSRSAATIRDSAFRVRAVAAQTAAARPATAAANKIVFGPPTPLSSGTIPTQASAAPARSAL